MKPQTTTTASLFLLIVLFYATINCKNNTQKQILDFGCFRLTTPPGWKILKEKGTDSYVGGLTNSIDTLWFDYGMYDVGFDEIDEHTVRIAEDTVNGLPATIIKAAIAGKALVSMHILKAGERNQYTIWGLNLRDTKAVLQIYKSLVFPFSDTLKNPPFSSSNFIYTFSQSAKGLYQHNCASCHAINKRLTGPALSEVIPLRSREWVSKFFTNRETKGKDSLQLQLEKEYQMSCYQYIKLSSSDIDRIYTYIIARQKLMY